MSRLKCVSALLRNLKSHSLSLTLLQVTSSVCIDVLLFLKASHFLLPSFHLHGSLFRLIVFALAIQRSFSVSAVFCSPALQISAVRLPREPSNPERLKGFGYAEFDDVESLLSALSLSEEVRGIYKDIFIWVNPLML